MALCYSPNKVVEIIVIDVTGPVDIGASSALVPGTAGPISSRMCARSEDKVERRKSGLETVVLTIERAPSEQYSESYLTEIDDRSKG